MNLFLLSIPIRVDITALGNYNQESRYPLNE